MIMTLLNDEIDVYSVTPKHNILFKKYLRRAFCIKSIYYSYYTSHECKGKIQEKYIWGVWGVGWGCVHDIDTD